MVTNRGQALTLEAFTATLLLIEGVIFTFQIITVFPLMAGASSQPVENQQLQVARCILDSAVKNESLKRTLLY